MATAAIIAPLLYNVASSTHKVTNFFEILTMFLGLIYSAWTIYCIFIYNEVTFYRLSEYKKWMKALSQMLVFMENDIGPQQISYTKSKESTRCVINLANKEKFQLYHGENWYVWLENWTRIEKLACIYFENR